MMDTSTPERRRGRGGARPGAGRPRTDRRLILDADTAALLRDLTRIWREREPQCHWTAARVVEQLVTLAMLHERDGAPL